MGRRPMIVRPPKSKNHAIIGIDVLEDSRLSWSARGVTAYLFAFSDGQGVLRGHLDHASPDERHEVEQALRELAAAGYITFDEVAAS